MGKAKYLELSTDLIAEGKFKKKVDAEIRRVFRELREYEAEVGKTGKAVINAKITINSAKGMNDHYQVKFVVKSAVPVVESSTLVKQKNGRLLCRPEGSAEDSPDQAILQFDDQGNPVAGVDPDSGEEYGTAPQESGVVGRVNAAQA